MPQTIVASPANSSFSPERMQSQRGRELVKLVAATAAAGDTSNVYQTQLIQKPAIVEGGNFTATITGNQVTFATGTALAAGTYYVWVAEAL